MNEPNRPVMTTATTAAQFTTSPPKATVQAKPAETKPQPLQNRKVRFEVDIPKARSISVVGTFNDWTPGATPMVFIGGTRWFKDLFLVPGRYEYRFVVDGKWVDPPKAKAYVPNPHGGRNAVVEVV
jgi:1,4-alpha-glucan branching enzyme